MYEDLASIRETVDLSAREVLDDALTFLTRLYHYRAHGHLPHRDETRSEWCR